jgi:hypothetical protein
MVYSIYMIEYIAQNAMHFKGLHIMTNINASSLFNTSMVSAAFDAAITTDAEHGRVSALFSQALESAYGLALPASPALSLIHI